MDEKNIVTKNTENVSETEEIIKQEEQKPVTHKRKKPKHLGSIIWLLSIVVIAVAISFGIIFAGADYLGVGFGRGGMCSLEVKKGSPTVTIAKQLKETGAVKSPLLFRIYAKLKHYDSKFSYGVYNFDSELGYDGIARMLMEEGATAKSTKVTIVEGQNIDDIAEMLEKKGVCTKSDFIFEVQEGEFNFDFIDKIPTQSVYYRLEGYLYPETYDFYSYDSKECAHLAVQKMLSTFDKKIKNAKIDINGVKIGESKYTFHEIVTMASIVEMEAGNHPKEKSKVAAVFFNRLNSYSFATLGSSPTRKYPYGDGKYNTYECEGLPVGPLCCVGIDSVKATCNPEKDFEYYYFVTDAKMNFYYKKTLAEHNAIIAKLKAEKNWIYEE